MFFKWENKLLVFPPFITMGCWHNWQIGLFSSIGWPLKFALKPNSVHATDLLFDFFTNSTPCAGSCSLAITVLVLPPWSSRDPVLSPWLSLKSSPLVPALLSSNSSLHHILYCMNKTWWNQRKQTTWTRCDKTHNITQWLFFISEILSTVKLQYCFDISVMYKIDISLKAILLYHYH